jgi:glycosyltransferase involved in cell wall biosynthesis
MKILAVYSTDRILGGAEISFTLTLKSVQAGGCPVLAAVPAEGRLSAFLQRNNLSVAILPQETLRGFRVARLLQPEPSWVKLVDEYRPDIIHCNAIRPALYAQAVGRRCGVPVILHARKELRDPTDLFLVSRLAGIICISNVVRSRFPRTGRAVFRVIYNPVDVEEFRNSSGAADLRRQWCRTGDEFLIGLPSRFSPIKGQLRLVRSAPAVVAQCSQVRFVLIGEEDGLYPGYMAEVHAAVQDLGLSERFVFAGFHEDMHSVYGALDAVVFPTSSEAFGRIVIEAGAAQKPLVANDLDVIREILPTPADDYVVNCDHPDQFSERIVRVVTDPAYREILTRRLYDHVVEKFSLDAHWEQMSAFYADVVGAFNKRTGF